MNINKVKPIAHVEVCWVGQFFIDSDIVGVHITSSIVDRVQPAHDAGNVPG